MNTRRVIRGELALMLMVVLNSMAVVLLLHSGFGLSPMASVPHTWFRLFPGLTLGTWNYIFQTILVALLMVARRKFVPTYLLAFVVGVAFGVGVDVHELWISTLPTTLPARVACLLFGMAELAVGISLANHCKLPIVPADLFPRELSATFSWPYKRVKTTGDLVCLSITVGLSLGLLDSLEGVGLGTVLCALFMGRMAARCGAVLDRHFRFVSFLEPN